MTSAQAAGMARRSWRVRGDASSQPDDRLSRPDHPARTTPIARRSAIVPADVAAAFLWGFLAASSLVVGGVVALHWTIPERVLGMVMAFGSGVLISAVAFELVAEAFRTS